MLFHLVRANDMVWSMDRGELSLTLTKVERNKLWEQFDEVPEPRRDESGAVIPEIVPEALSSRKRMDQFRKMVQGDDGQRTCYDDLDPSSRDLVDAMRRFEHARATGDRDALALAELDLEEFGKLVI